MLLSQFKPDIEQEGDVKFDGYLIEGASPLWCAAGIKVVKMCYHSCIKGLLFLTIIHQVLVT
jgi:hypothetical protein